MYKPNKWIAGALGLTLQWFAFLYVARLKWFAFYFAMTLVIVAGLLAYLLHQREMETIPQMLAVMVATWALPVICAIHAFLISARHEGIAPRPWYSRWYGLVSILLSMVLVFVLFRAFCYEPFRIPAGSMLPGFKVGTVVIVEKSGFGNYQAYGISFLKTRPSKELHRGDVIVFQSPENESVAFIKRIIGMPGDTIEYKDKRLTINNVAVPSSVIEESAEFEIVEERFENATHRVRIDKHRIAADAVHTVPAEHYFVMGDNRDDSRDSRYWGFLPAENILGRVIHTVQPPAPQE